MFALLSLGYFYLAHLLPKHSWLLFAVSLIICHAFLVVSIALARGADNSYPFAVRPCWRAIKNAIVVILVSCAVYAIVWYLAAVLASLLTVQVPHNDYSQSAGFALLSWLSAGTVSFFVVYCCVMVAGLWFLLPLAVFHKLGLLEAVKLAKYAERKNLLVIVTASYLPFSFFFVLFLLSELALAAAFLALPLTGIYLYVSYRHVFLGNRENAPAAISSVAQQTA